MPPRSEEKKQFRRNRLQLQLTMMFKGTIKWTPARKNHWCFPCCIWQLLSVTALFSWMIEWVTLDTRHRRWTYDDLTSMTYRKFNRKIPDTFAFGVISHCHCCQSCENACLPNRQIREREKLNYNLKLLSFLPTQAQTQKLLTSNEWREWLNEYVFTYLCGFF